MKLQAKSPKGKALVALIQMTSKHPAMLDKKQDKAVHAKEAHGTHGTEQDDTRAAEHGVEHAVEPIQSQDASEDHGIMESLGEGQPSESSHSSHDESDMDSLQHDHESDDCHDACPVRVAMHKRMGRK